MHMAVRASAGKARMTRRRFLAVARLRRYQYVRALNAGENTGLPDVPADPGAGIAVLEAALRAHATELQKSAAAEERKKLEAELAELTDRALLATMLPTVQDELERLRTIHFLDHCLGDTTTNAITKVGNELADTVITPNQNTPPCDAPTAAMHAQRASTSPAMPARRSACRWRAPGSLPRP